MGRGGGGERKPLLEKIAEPMGSAGKQHRSRLDACGLRVHPDHLVFLWVDCNGVDMFRLEILDQRHPRTLILDQKGVIACAGSPSAVEFDYLALKLGILKTAAEYIEHIDAFAADLNNHAGGIARKLVCTERCIPAHDGSVARRSAGRILICREPVPSYEAAAFGHGRLLILCREVHRPHV